MRQHQTDVDPITAYLAGEVRAERARVGLTQAQVAARAGMQTTVYARLEQGARDIDSEQLRRIAVALGTLGSTLYRRAEDRLVTAEAAALRRASTSEDDAPADELPPAPRAHGPRKRGSRSTGSAQA